MTDSIRVRDIRQELGLTILELSKLLGVNRRTVLRWERGAEPRAKQLRKLREILDAFRRGESIQVLLQRTNDLVHSETSPSPYKKALRFGICCDFLDTLLPLLGHAKVTGLYESHGLPPIEFVPVHWDLSALNALVARSIDLTFFNQFCAEEFQTTFYGRGLHVLVKPPPKNVPDFHKSGAPYIVFSGNGLDQSVNLLECLFSSETLVICPSADMRQCLQLLARSYLVHNGNADIEHALCMHPGAGARFFIEAHNRFLPRRTLAYIGGQDQRAILERELGKSKNRNFKIIDIDDEGISRVLPELKLDRRLRFNRLIALDEYAPILAVIEQVIVKAARMIADEMNRGNRLLFDKAVSELAHWYHLYNTYFYGQDKAASEQEIRSSLPSHLERVSELSPALALFKPHAA